MPDFNVMNDSDDTYGMDRLEELLDDLPTGELDISNTYLRGTIPSRGARGYYSIAHGYIGAAQGAIHYHSGTPLLDSLVYPVVFLVRHSVEIILKGAIKSHREALDQEPSFPHIHKLEDLFDEFLELHNLLAEKLRQTDDSSKPEGFPDPDDPDDPLFREIVPEAKELVRYISKLDPVGDRFRYRESRADTAPDLSSDTGLEVDMGKLVNAAQFLLLEFGPRMFGAERIADRFKSGDG